MFLKSGTFPNGAVGAWGEVPCAPHWPAAYWPVSEQNPIILSRVARQLLVLKLWIGFRIFFPHSYTGEILYFVRVIL